MRVKCSTRLSLCKKIRGKTMVIPRTWIGKKWYSITEDSPQREWDKIAELMMLTFAESQHPVFRSTSPMCKGGGKLSIHHFADFESIEAVFRTIICVNQLSLYGQSQICAKNVNVYCHHWTYFSIVLILQEQFCTSELSKVIQDAILLILRYKTMS